MLPAINSALQGLAMNQRSLSGHAHRISRWGTDEAATGSESIDLQEELVGVMTSRRGYEANLAVLRTSDEMLGTLIDTFA